MFLSHCVITYPKYWCKKKSWCTFGFSAAFFEAGSLFSAGSKLFRRVRPHPQGALWHLTQPSPQPPGADSQTGALLSDASAEWGPPAAQGQSHLVSASPGCRQAQSVWLPAEHTNKMSTQLRDNIRLFIHLCKNVKCFNI